MDAKQIAAEIKGSVKNSLDGELSRDRRILERVCVELGLKVNDVNKTQVLLAMNAKGISAKEAFPKVKYHSEKPTTIVHDEAEEKALGAGWSDEPKAKAEVAEKAPAKKK